jgi:hypothetical protein
MEQRDNKEPASVQTKEDETPSEIVADPGSDLPDEAEKRIALCAACELRDSCKKPVPPGGIWHCADFR